MLDEFAGNRPLTSGIDVSMVMYCFIDEICLEVCHSPLGELSQHAVFSLQYAVLTEAVVEGDYDRLLAPAEYLLEGFNHEHLLRVLQNLLGALSEMFRLLFEHRTIFGLDVDRSAYLDRYTTLYSLVDRVLCEASFETGNWMHQ